MKIELKRFTTNARLSQETTAFAADVWVNGKKVGTAENDGHGGSHTVHLDRSVRNQVEAYGKPLVPAEFANFTSGTEWVVQLLLEAELQKRADKSLAKRLAKYDAQEKAHCKQHGLCSARLRHGDTWLWFGYKPGADPMSAAATIAATKKMAVEELVVLS